MADRCNSYTLNSEPGDIYEQVKKMFLFGKDNFTEINSIPDDLDEIDINKIRSWI